MKQGETFVALDIAYALAGQTAFAVVIALIAADPAQDHPDFQKQIELDLLALKEEIMRDQAAGKRVNVFRQEQIAQKPRTRRVPRPIIPTV